ncbi:MAG: hypothetical protein Q9223_007792 [Gallowayella weberi]
MEGPSISWRSQDEASSLQATPEPSQISLNTRPSQRLQRPRHSEIQWRENLVAREEIPPEEPKAKLQASKGRLLTIFTRAKSTKGVKPVIEPGRQGENGLAGRENPDSFIYIAHNSPDDINGTTIDPFLAGEPTKQRPLKTKRSKSFKKDPTATKQIPWDPPPLFQAYPQSIKHITVSTPAMSADAILRYHSDKKRRTKRRDTAREARGSNGVTRKEDEEEGNGADGLQLGDWSQKIFVLVTSGYFLQYAGEGSFDRLPEKVMPIGRESAAFASDAVPGKHWVLQVSHASDENGNPKMDTSWSFRKKLGLGGDLKRCSASNFLLVMDDPKELDAWLSVVRKEIESWGGQRYHHTATAQPGDEEAAWSFQQASSCRYKVKRDPNQFSNDAHESNATFGGTVTNVVPPLPGRKCSTATQNSAYCSPSTSNETASTDQNILDRLRDSPQMSCVSAGTKTLSTTTRDPSPFPSPTKPLFQLSGLSFSHEPLTMDERSDHTASQFLCQDNSQKPLDCNSSTSLYRPPSTGRISRTSSSGAPNFSVPSFSKRYSSAHSTPPLSTASSSSASNFPRKSMSPPSSCDRYDPPPPKVHSPVADMHSQGPRSLKTPAVVQKDRSTTHLIDESKSTVTNPAAHFSSPTEKIVPRRFSSLEYARGISPASVRPSPTPSPHPAPTLALPALPESANSTLPAPARTLRRPISMQVHSFPSSTTISQSLRNTSSPPMDDAIFSLPPPARPPPPPPPPPTSTKSPAVEPPNKIHNRRSMPHLTRPPYDPPDCPLPTPPVPNLPPIKLSSGSLRRLVERPQDSWVA